MYFSVIVTVYKVEAHLNQCVDSILAQTFEDFELILVDDGSPDRCGAICDEYAKRDARVKVLHQENRGVTHARKSGLLASEGRYIVFIDGDDWVGTSYLWFGYRIMESVHADMVLFACSYEYGDVSKKIQEPADAGVYEEASIKERLYPAILMDCNMDHMSWSVFAKVFSRSLAESCFLQAEEHISFGEDMLCVLQAYLEAKRIFISHIVTNFYRIQEQSASHGFQLGHYRQVSMVLEKLQKFAGLPYALPEDFDRQIERYGAYMCFVLMIHAVDDGRFRYLGEIKRQMKQPLLKDSLRDARFETVSPKTRAAFGLLKKNRVLLSYCFLRACRRIKRMIAGKKVVD